MGTADVQLPDNSIGISDIESHRECARRMSFQMRRHIGPGEQSDRAMPESEVAGAVWARGYGSAIHEAIRAVEDGFSVEDAIQQAWDQYGRYLDPEDLELLRDDLEIYRTRDAPGTRTVMLEEELRVPLFTHEGVQIYFRGRIDRLYELLAEPGHFLHTDYKSSKWPKTEQEVHNDRQLWAYNWSIHDFFPEVDRLDQFYDQLRFGKLPTRKSAEQRQQIKDWLVKEVTTILKDNDVQEDGLLAPTYNEWCPWCPIMESCPVIGQLSDFSLTRIAALAPVRPKLKKDNTPSKVMEPVPLDPSRIEEYVEELATAKRASSVLDRFEKSVKDILRELPAERRLELGYELRERTNNIYDEAAARALHEALGDRFYELVKLTRTSIEGNLAEDDQLREWALGLATQRKGSPSVVQVRET